MEPHPFPRGAIVATAAAALLAIAVGGWWYCDRSPATAFLASHPGAEWIIDAAPPHSVARRVAPVTAVFTRSFDLDTAPAEATLTVRAFRKAGVQINGRAVDTLGLTGRNWKQPVTARIAGWLRAGTNEITLSVTNDAGPPALWLRLEAGANSLASDESWRVSVAGSTWQNCRLAKQPVPIPDWSRLHERQSTVASACHAWREVAALMVTALGLWLLGCLWCQRRAPSRQPEALLYLLLAIIVVVRAGLFAHDLPDLDNRFGFDAPDHVAYVRFIQHNGALPLPKDGWEMHQPPLYYLISAALLDLTGISADQPAAVIPLRTINGGLALIHCWLILLCLRRIFPDNPSAQAVGLLTAAFLPTHLYLSMYVANDPLAGVLTTAAFYSLLRILQSDREDLRLYAGLGLTLGGALLSKLTALPAVSVAFAALALRQVAERKATRWKSWTGTGLAALLCLGVCAWPYVRVWLQAGLVTVPSSQNASWSQDPGFHTAGYYLRFGQALIFPLFSGYYSFADGMYSTWWGDGLISGSSELIFRPPWNYELMDVAYLLSTVLTAMAVIGFAVAVRRFCRRFEPEWFVWPAVALAMLAALIYMTISAPWLAAAKAFYAFPALLPFGVLVAAGWNWLTQKNRAVRAAAWWVVLLWALAAAASFWIPDQAPETWRSRGITQLDARQYSRAAACFDRALQLDPKDADSHYLLAETLEQQGRDGEAIEQYAAALTLRPDSPDLLNALALLLARGQKGDAERAIELAGRAWELTGGRRTDIACTLALAQVNAGRIPEATAAARRARDLAAQRGERNYQDQMEYLLGQLQHAEPAGQPH